MFKTSKRFYCADFETTTGNVSLEETRVWLGYIENIFDEYDNHIFKTIDDFFKILETFNKSTEVFFHNLNWDGEFILHYLVDNYKFKKQEVGKFSPKLEKGEFTTLSDGVSSHYVIRFKNYTYGKEIKFLCSFKHLLSSVSTLQGLKEKEKIDYDKIEYTKETLNYVKKDVKTVIPFMKAMLEKHRKYMGITSSGTAMKQFKSLTPEYKNWFENQVKVGKIQNGVYTDGEWDYYKQFYRGGWTYLPQILMRKLIRGRIIVDDCNSIYPYVMRDMSHPVGEALNCKSKTCNHFKLLEVNISAKLIKGNVPSIPSNNGYSQHIDYLEECNNQNLFITEEYLQLIRDTYEISYFKIIKQTHFMTRSDIFTDYIDKWQEVKQNSIKHSFDYNFSKLMQNQLYGKFGMTPLRRKYYLKPYDKKVHTRKDTKIYGDKVKMVFAFDYDLTKPSYIPMAISITDKAKILTIKLANLVNQCNHIIPTGGFLYSDTDSIHFSICDACLEKYESQVEIHKTKLGAWDREKIVKYGYYIKRKCYLEFNNLWDKIDRDSCGLAGIDKINIEKYTYREIIRGLVKPTKKQKLKIKGGVILIDKEVKL